jgi:hypothetical protein
MIIITVLLEYSFLSIIVDYFCQLGMPLEIRLDWDFRLGRHVRQQTPLHPGYISHWHLVHLLLN